MLIRDGAYLEEKYKKVGLPLKEQQISFLAATKEVA